MKYFSASGRFALALLFFVSAQATVMGQIPSGYYNTAAGLNGAPLKTALHNIVKNHTEKTYDYLWTAFYTTDDKTDGTVWDMYSDIPNGTLPYVYNFGPPDQCANTPGYENGCYNREHSFCNSWWGGGQAAADTMYTDLFHIVPSDSKVNSMRNNYPYGQVSEPTWTSLNGSKLGPCTTAGYSGIVFEPRDEYKGDLARNLLYMATRYESRIALWKANIDAVLDGTPYPAYDQWFIDLLLAWHTADPVSQKEIDRNNEIYTTYQHNRNPFIDHPEYAGLIWNATTATEPTNHAASFSSHTITLNWTDATGSTTPTAYLVRMSNVGFGSLANPSDGIAVANDANNLNVAAGLQTCTFSSLTEGTPYYFKIFGYTGSGASIDYKTDGSPMQTSIIAQ